MRIVKSADMFDRYRVDQLIEGAKSRVYVVTDLGAHPPRRAVIKMMGKELVADKEQRARFFAEAGFLLTLSSYANTRYPGAAYPFISRAIGIIPAGEDFAIKLNYIEGATLRELIESRPGIATRRASNIAIQICTALLFCQRFGLRSHRDLKPENIMVSTQGDAYLLDFGNAKLGRDPGRRPSHSKGVPFEQYADPLWREWEARAPAQRAGRFQTPVGATVGTPQYMSPEHFVSMHQLDERSDIYSLGVILYEMLSGKRPFYGETYSDFESQHRYEAPEYVGAHNNALPEGLCKIVHTCLQKSAADRFNTIRELKEALKDSRTRVVH